MEIYAGSVFDCPPLSIRSFYGLDELDDFILIESFLLL